MLRELLSTFIRTLVVAEADALCGAGYGQRGSERNDSRNGYRYGRHRRSLGHRLNPHCISAVSCVLGPPVPRDAVPGSAPSASTSASLRQNDIQHHFVSVTEWRPCRGFDDGRVNMRHSDELRCAAADSDIAGHGDEGVHGPGAEERRQVEAERCALTRKLRRGPSRCIRPPASV
jgi:hypothetical protein